MGIKKNKTKIVLLILIFVIFGLLFICLNRSDGMENVNDINIYYRVHTESNNWGLWKRNGLTSGNIKSNYNINNIEFKIKKKYKKYFGYEIYNFNNEWIDEEDVKNENIKAIKINVYNTFADQYMVCYRTYNKKDKWLGWSCNGEKNGNKNENINAIEIKFIPKNGIKSEYLKDYSNDKKTNNF